MLGSLLLASAVACTPSAPAGREAGPSASKAASESAAVAAHASKATRPVPASPWPSGPILVDVTAEVGVHFSHDSGDSGLLYMPESMGAGAALVDIDRDGDLDLYLVQGGAIDATVDGDRPSDRLLRNTLETGRLAFVDITEEAGIRATGYGMGAAAGDYDGDGWVDLYITNFGRNQLWHNRGVDRAGRVSFEDTTEKSGTDDVRWSVPALWFDFDGDDQLDLFVGNYLDFTLARHRPCRNKAGALDFCAPQVYGPVADRLLRGRGDGTFEDTTATSGLAAGDAGKALGALAADLDGDGWLDLYVANDGTPNNLWLRVADGRFRDEAFFAGCAVNGDGLPEASMGVDAEDMDGDGDLDLVMSHFAGETNTLYRNDHGLFDDITSRSGIGAVSLAANGFGIGWLDLDRDGVLDLVVTNGAVRAIEALRTAGDPYPYHQPDQLLRGLGSGRYEVVPTPVLAVSLVGRGLVRGDLDNDGDLDLVLTSNQGPARVLLDEVASPNTWLGVLAVAGDPAHDVAGAWVGVEQADTTWVWRRAARDGSYASSDDPRALFVITGASGTRRVQIRWPGPGRSELFTNVATGRYNTLARGQGTVIRDPEALR